MVRVVSAPSSIVASPISLYQVHAAIGAGRMGVDRGPAAVELLPYRCELRVAEPFVAVACHHADAVGLERVEGIRDLLEASVDVRQRQHGEQAEAPRVI